MAETGSDISTTTLVLDGVQLRLSLATAHLELYQRAAQRLNQQVQLSKNNLSEATLERDIQALRLAALQVTAYLIRQESLLLQYQAMAQRLETLSVQLDLALSSPSSAAD